MTRPAAAAPRVPPNAAPCANCAAPLAGPYCAACGQRAFDPAAPTWHVARDAVAEAVDVDGRLLGTARALLTPGRLTADFLAGRRAPYLGPLKLLLLAGAALSATWLATRGPDRRYYGYAATDSDLAAYIGTVVRGTFAAAAAGALLGWLLARGRRRLVDEAVFAAHLVAALTLLAALSIWLGTAWKVAWGRDTNVPAWLPALPFLLHLPLAALGALYAATAARCAYRAPWWAAALRAAAVLAAGLGAVYAALVAPRLFHPVG